MQQTISQTENGKVFRCSSCNKIHIEFNNLNLNFNDRQYKCFADYISGLDGEFYENRNQGSNYSRKITLKTGDQNVNLLFNKSELHELQQLLNPGRKSDMYHTRIIKNISIKQLLN